MVNKCKNCGVDMEKYKANFVYDTGECGHWNSKITKKEMELFLSSSD